MFFKIFWPVWGLVIYQWKLEYWVEELLNIFVYSPAIVCENSYTNLWLSTEKLGFQIEDLIILNIRAIDKNCFPCHPDLPGKKNKKEK